MSDTPKIINQSIETTPISALSLHPRNANQGDAGAIYESIEANGFYGTIVAQRSTGHVLAGNHRLQAAQMAGIDEVPVCWVDVDNERALRLLLADNRTTRLGHDDESALSELLAELSNSESGLAGTGFDGDDLDQLINDLAGGAGNELSGDVDEVPDASDALLQKWRIQTGQLWRIGAHRLLCGDSQNPSDVERCLSGALPQTLIYDPPWEIELARVERAFGSVLAFCDGARARDVIERFGLPAWVFAWDCVSSWYTPNRPLRRMKNCFWFGDVTSYHFDGAHYGEPGESKTVTNTRGSYDYNADPRGKHLSDVFSLPITQSHSDENATGHRHEKPLDWVRLLIGNCSDGIVYDPFAGSGTSIIACQQLGRTCYALEIEPKFVAVCLERAEKFGLAPTLE